MTNLENISIPGPSGRLEICVEVPQQQPPKGVTICAHPHPLQGGNNDHKTIYTIAHAALEAGFITLRPNFRGVKGSEGTYDAGHGECEDLLAVHRWVQEQYPTMPLILAGFSFGAYVITRLVRHLEESMLPIQKVVLVGLSTINFECPIPRGDNVSIIHGEKDDITPLSGILDWSRTASCVIPVCVIPNADHFFSRKLHILKKVVSKEFQ